MKCGRDFDARWERAIGDLDRQLAVIAGDGGARWRRASGWGRRRRSRCDASGAKDHDRQHGTGRTPPTAHDATPPLAVVCESGFAASRAIVAQRWSAHKRGRMITID